MSLGSLDSLPGVIQACLLDGEERKIAISLCIHCWPKFMVSMGSTLGLEVTLADPG